MKIAELNIGLSSKSLGEITPETALNELYVHDFRVISSRIVKSVSEDGVENCLACKVELPNGWQENLVHVSNELGQDCIAVAGFIGQSPYDTFCAELWQSPEVIPDSYASGFDGYASDLETALHFIQTPNN